MVSAVWAGVSQGVGPSPCRVNIYFPRVCRVWTARVTQEEEGCHGVPIWQSNPQTALCSQGEAETQHTCCLRYLLAREVGKARDLGKRWRKGEVRLDFEGQCSKGTCSNDQSLPQGGSAE